MLPGSARLNRAAPCWLSRKTYDVVWEIGVARAPVAGSGAAPAWICLVSKDHAEVSSALIGFLLAAQGVRPARSYLGRTEYPTVPTSWERTPLAPTISLSLRYSNREIYELGGNHDGAGAGAGRGGRAGRAVGVAVPGAGGSGRPDGRTARRNVGPLPGRRAELAHDGTVPLGRNRPRGPGSEPAGVAGAADHRRDQPGRARPAPAHGGRQRVRRLGLDDDARRHGRAGRRRADPARARGEGRRTGPVPDRARRADAGRRRRH